MTPFVQQMARAYLETKLPEIIGFVAENVIKWIDKATTDDIERVSREMKPAVRKRFVAMCNFLRFPPEETTKP